MLECVSCLYTGVEARGLLKNHLLLRQDLSLGLPRLSGITNCAATILRGSRDGTVIFMFAGHFTS